MHKIISGLMAATVAATFAMAFAAPVAARGMMEMGGGGGGGHFGGGGGGHFGGGGGHFGGGGGHFSGGHGRFDGGMNRHMAFADHGGGRMRFDDHRNFRDHDHFHDHHQHDRFFPGFFFVGGYDGSYDYYNYYAEPDYAYAHVRWCYGHHRSYRAYDNTFQPYGGPRHQCYSPYS